MIEPSSRQFKNAITDYLNMITNLLPCIPEKLIRNGKSKLPPKKNWVYIKLKAARGFIIKFYQLGLIT